MLPGQNDLITETRLRLKRLGKRKNLRFDLGYADYINLLAKLADIGAERSVLNTEMILYANATSLAEKFLECR